MIRSESKQGHDVWFSLSLLELNLYINHIINDIYMYNKNNFPYIFL